MGYRAWISGLVVIFSQSIGLYGAPIDFMSASKLAPLLSALPHIKDRQIYSILRDTQTMFYDHDSLIPVYQDSVTPVLGVRANTTGLKIAVEGDRIFTPQGFRFPFGHTAGLDQTSGVYVLTFWSPPRHDGGYWPVAFYKDDTTRWRWIFPTGTVFGEILFTKSPSGRQIPFEIRVRHRYLTGWSVDVLRPFPTAESLANQIERFRPNWRSVPILAKAMEHLKRNDTLVKTHVDPGYYTKAFQGFDGFLDLLPDLGDSDLVENLLTQTEFVSALGEVWKRDGQNESYAASTEAAFSIVPKGYRGGLYAVNEVSCNRCHEQSGRQIGEFNFNTVLYGEVWGEDRIFTWHPFDPIGRFDGPYESNRIVDSRFSRAGLLEDYSPSSLHPATQYEKLPRPFKIHWR